MATFIPPVMISLMADIKDFQAKKAQVVHGLKDIEKQGEVTSARLKAVGNKVANGILLAGVGLAVASTKMAADFQEKMTLLETSAGEAHANIKLVHDGILSMAGEVGQAPKDLADGFFLIASAGYHGAEGLKVLEAAAQGAKVGGAEMMTVADAVTTVLKDWGMSADDATTATSGLIQVVGLGKTNLQDLGTAMAKVAPIGSALGLSFADVGGAMANMTAAGVSADQAAEGLRTMFIGLATPTDNAQKMLQWVGLSAEQVVQSMKDPKKGLVGTLSMIETALGKKVPAGSQTYIRVMNELMGGQTGYAASLFLTGKNLDSLKNNVETLQGVMAKNGGQVLGWDKVQKNLNTQLDQFSASLQSIATSAGEWFLPKATAFIQWANDAIGYMKKHPLITRIATDAALAAFGIALGVKVKNAVKSLFGMGAMQLNTGATELNTAALNRLAAVMGASDVIPGGGGIPGKVKNVGKVVGPLAAILGTEWFIKNQVVDPTKKSVPAAINNPANYLPETPKTSGPKTPVTTVGPGGLVVPQGTGGGYSSLFLPGANIPGAKSAPTTNKVKIKVTK